jgi:HEAT repeat protein
MSQVDEREARRLAAIASNKRDAAPIVDALHSAGFMVDTVADLFNKKLDYQSAIPLLMEWLPRVANRDVKEDIVRALSVKWAKRAAPLLIDEFERAEDSTGTGLRWAIGNALEVLADDQIADRMIALAGDRRFGTARQMLVLGLGKLRDPRVPDVLLKLLSDEDVVGHAVMALGKLRVTSAQSRIEALLDHPKSWIRAEAKKALAKIDRDD